MLSAVEVCERVSAQSDAVQATHMLHNLVNDMAEEGRGKNTPLADSGCCCEAVGRR